MSKKSKALHGVIQLFLILFLLLYLSPLFLVGINAFKSYQEIMTDVMSLPSAFTLDNIKNVFHDMKYPATFLNTLNRHSNRNSRHYRDRFHGRL